MATRDSAALPLRSLLVPAAITLAVTLARLAGELMGGPRRLFGDSIRRYASNPPVRSAIGQVPCWTGRAARGTSSGCSNGVDAVRLASSR